MAKQFTIDDFYYVIELAEDYREARGTTVYWFSHPNTDGQGSIMVIVRNDMQADVYSDISMELFGHPNEIEISEGYSGLQDATHSRRI